MRPLLMSLKDHRQLTLRGLRKLLYLVKLFPSSFKETLTEKLLIHLHTLFETLSNSYRNGEIKGELVQFHQYSYFRFQHFTMIEVT